MGNVNERLIKAIETGDNKTALKLVEECDPQYIYEDGDVKKSLLYIACDYKRIDVALALVERKCSLSHVFDLPLTTYSIFHVACTNHLRPVVVKLLPHFKSIALPLLCRFSYYDLAEQLIPTLDSKEINYCYKDEKCTGTTLNQIIRDGNIKVFDIYIASGKCDINITDYRGVGPFIIACEHGHSEIAIKLLDMNADIVFNCDLVYFDSKERPMYNSKKMIPVVKRLIEMGVTDFHYLMIVTLFTYKQYEYIHKLLDNYTRQDFNRYGSVLLTMSCSINNVDLASRLIHCNNYKSMYGGKTAAQWIIYHNMDIRDEAADIKHFRNMRKDVAQDAAIELYLRYNKLKRQVDLTNLLRNHLDVDTASIVCNYLV